MAGTMESNGWKEQGRLAIIGVGWGRLKGEWLDGYTAGISNEKL